MSSASAVNAVRSEVGVVLPVQRPLSLHLDTTYYPTRYSEVRQRSVREGGSASVGH